MRRRWIILLELFFLAGLCAWAAMSLIDLKPKPANSIDLKIQLRDATDLAYLVQLPDGSHRYLVTEHDGDKLSLTPEEFASRVYGDQKSRGWMSVLLNTSGPFGFVWVSVGLLGQVLFTGRMIVQWLVSEREKRSTVPPVFWWMSLVGSGMLLVYFLWRKDPVGLLGQAFGSFIYVRNLWMIYGQTSADKVLDSTDSAVH